MTGLLPEPVRWLIEKVKKGKKAELVSKPSTWV
jgi:hypothetical protein